MIDNKFCSDQAKRFAGLINYPAETAAKREIALAIQCFATEGQAEAFVDGWIANESLSPLPAAIRKAAYEAKEAENADWLENKRCPDCSGSGYRLETRVARALPGMAVMHYEFAVLCDHVKKSA